MKVQVLKCEGVEFVKWDRFKKEVWLLCRGDPRMHWVEDEKEVENLLKIWEIWLEKAHLVEKEGERG